MSGTSNTPTTGATGKTDFTGIVNALQMLAQAIGQNGKALDAIKAALPGSLPAPSAGNALDMVRINAGGTAYEVRTPSQVASDIGVVAPPAPATVAPLVDGTAAVGTSLLYARQDHVHPAIPGWQTIASYTPSAVASQAIPLPSGFRLYRLNMVGATLATTSAFLQGQFSINGGTTWITGASAYAEAGLYNNVTTPTSYSQQASAGIMSLGFTSGGGAAINGNFQIYPGTASLDAMMQGDVVGFGSNWYVGNFAIICPAGAAINAIKVLASSGTFSGTFILEGLV